MKLTIENEKDIESESISSFPLVRKNIGFFKKYRILIKIQSNMPYINRIFISMCVPVFLLFTSKSRS